MIIHENAILNLDGSYIICEQLKDAYAIRSWDKYGALIRALYENDDRVEILKAFEVLLYKLRNGAVTVPVSQIPTEHYDENGLFYDPRKAYNELGHMFELREVEPNFFCILDYSGKIHYSCKRKVTAEKNFENYLHSSCTSNTHLIDILNKILHLQRPFSDLEVSQLCKLYDIELFKMDKKTETTYSSVIDNSNLFVDNFLYELGMRRKYEAYQYLQAALRLIYVNDKLTLQKIMPYLQKINRQTIPTITRMMASAIEKAWKKNRYPFEKYFGCSECPTLSEFLYYGGMVFKNHMVK